MVRSSQAIIPTSLRAARGLSRLPLHARTALPLSIALLGPPRITADGAPVVVDTRKAVALLAYVAVVGRPVARETLADLLWPESDPYGARGALRRTLSVLRSALGGRWLRIDRSEVALLDDDVELDVRTFRALVASGQHGHDHADRDVCAACRHRLERATDGFAGRFLEGFALRDSAAFDEWQTLEGQALDGELAHALRRQMALQAAGGATAAASSTARRLLALDPLDEGAHRGLMGLHARAGDRAAVARQYRECVAVLETELGVPPSAETTELHRTLMDGGATAPGPGPTSSERSPTPLDDAATDLLAAAAILGDSVDPDIAAELAGQLDGAPAAFDALTAAGILLEPPGDVPGGRYRFADRATRAATVARLGLTRRRALHRRAADLLGVRLASTAADPAASAQVAEHLAAAGRPAEAAELHRRAGDAARRVSDHALASDQYHAAVTLAHPDQAGLYEAIGDVETLRGRYGDGLAAYERGAALADRGSLARFEHRLGSLHLRRAAAGLAELHLAAALSGLSDEPSVLRARVLADRSLVAVRRGDGRAAARLARASLHDARAIADAEGEAQAENLLAMLARRSGDIPAARRHLRRSLDRASRADGPGARIAALNNLALLERAVGNFEDALALTDDALRACRLMGDRHREAALRNNRADLLHALGRNQEAADELTRSVVAFTDVGDDAGIDPGIWRLVDW